MTVNSYESEVIMFMWKNSDNETCEDNTTANDSDREGETSSDIVSLSSNIKIELGNFEAYLMAAKSSRQRNTCSKSTIATIEKGEIYVQN